VNKEKKSKMGHHLHEMGLFECILQQCWEIPFISTSLVYYKILLTKKAGRESTQSQIIKSYNYITTTKISSHIPILLTWQAADPWSTMQKAVMPLLDFFFSNKLVNNIHAGIGKRMTAHKLYLCQSQCRPKVKWLVINSCRRIKSITQTQSSLYSLSKTHRPFCLRNWDFFCLSLSFKSIKQNYNF
jgi:hypothetical protein